MTRGNPLHASATVVFMVWESALDTQAGRLDLGYASAMGVVLFALLVVFTSASLWLTRRAEETA